MYTGCAAVQGIVFTGVFSNCGVELFKQMGSSAHPDHFNQTDSHRYCMFCAKRYLQCGVKRSWYSVPSDLIFITKSIPC